MAISRKGIGAAGLVLAALGMGTAAAQTTVGGVWLQRGPVAIEGGQVEGINNRPVSGAVEALAAHPTNDAILYIATVNGGIWRTGNATAASPTWVAQTANLPSGSMGAIAFDPTDTTRQTLVAGTARRSSYYRIGGARLGVLRTTDGGSNWTVLNPGGALSTRDVRAVVAAGSIVLAATPDGLYRTTSAGSGSGSFIAVSGASGSGLPAGFTSDLVQRPGTPATLYTTVISGSAPGLYRSTDTGANWSRVSSAAMDTQLGGASRARIAVRTIGQVFVGVVRAGRLAEVYRSADGSTGWTALGVPTTTEADGSVLGIHPGGQGEVHFSIAADPIVDTVVYVGGDRQPGRSESNFANPQWPNALGANDYSGRIFRGDSSLPAASRWTSLTHSGTSNNSAPHADSRGMAFDANGTLLQVDDGGVYRRNSPRFATGLWTSLVGNLSVTEQHGVGWDAVSDRVVGGTQDNGANVQRTVNTASVFDSILNGDGGDIAIEDRGSTTVSTRYSSAQRLLIFRRRTVNASNSVTSVATPTLTPVGSDPAVNPAFYTPISANAGDALRLCIGAQNGLYESFNRGDTVTRISTLQVNEIVGDPLVCGLPGNADYLLFGSGNTVRRRTTSGGTITSIATLPATVVDVDVDPANPQRLFAMTADRVYHSSAATPSFTEVSGNLATLEPGTLRSMALIATGDRPLVVGADRGVFIAFPSTGYATWYRYGTQLPTVPVYELEFDATDNVLLAGTLGRGAWIQTSFPSAPVLPALIFRNGFEAP